jgi:hypothetical protein
MGVSRRHSGLMGGVGGVLGMVASLVRVLAGVTHRGMRFVRGAIALTVSIQRCPGGVMGLVGCVPRFVQAMLRVASQLLNLVP